MIEKLLPAGKGAEGEEMVVRVRCSERADGDFACGEASSSAVADTDKAEHGQDQQYQYQHDYPYEYQHDYHSLLTRRQALMAGRWTWLKQVHEAGVVTVKAPGDAAGAIADGAVTAVPGAVLALHTADCAPVVLAGDGAVGVAHAGWRGVVAGAVAEVVAVLRSLAPVSGTGELRALLGPIIRPAAYEFTASDLDAVVGVVGSGAVAVTSWGTPALDLPAAVKAALHKVGVEQIDDLGFDTADKRFFSHRVRGDQQRMVTAVRLETL